MPQSSLGYNSEDDEDRAAALPLDTEDRASTNLRSPAFQLAAAPPEPPPVVVPQQQFGTPMAGALGNFEAVAPEPSNEAPSEPSNDAPAAPRLLGKGSPEIDDALAALNQGPEPMAPARDGYQEAAAEEMDRRQRASDQQHSGIHAYLRSKGIETEILPDGSHAIALSDDGSPRWKPTRSQPFTDPETGRPVVRERDDHGNLADVDLFSTHGIVHTDPQTGARFYMGPGNQPVDLQSPDPAVARMAQVKALKSDLWANEQLASHQIQRIKDTMAEAQANVKQMDAMPAGGGEYGGTAVSVAKLKNIVLTLSPSVQNGTADEDTQQRLKEAQDKLTRHYQDFPEHRGYEDAVAGAQAQIKALDDARKQDRDRRLALLMDPNTSSAVAAAQPSLKGNAGTGEVESAQVDQDAAQLAAQGRTTQSLALPRVLRNMKAQGVQVVKAPDGTTRPIDDAIQQAMNPPARVVAPKEEPPVAGSSASANFFGNLVNSSAITGNEVEEAVGRSLSWLSGGQFGQGLTDRAQQEMKYRRELQTGQYTEGNPYILPDGSAGNSLGATVDPKRSKDALTGIAGAIPETAMLALNPMATVATMSGVGAMKGGDQAVEEATARGDANPEGERLGGAGKAAATTAGTLAAYMAGGAVVGKLMPAIASPVWRGLTAAGITAPVLAAIDAGSSALAGGNAIPQTPAEWGQRLAMLVFFAGHTGFHEGHVPGQIEQVLNNVQTVPERIQLAKAQIAALDGARPLVEGQGDDVTLAKMDSDRDAAQKFLDAQNPRLVEKIRVRMQQAADAAKSTSGLDATEGSDTPPQSSPSGGSRSAEERADSPPEPAPHSPAGQAKAFTDTLAARDKLGPRLAYDQATGAPSAPIADEMRGHDASLHAAAKDATEAVPAPIRQRLAALVGGDTTANEAHFAGDVDAPFAAAHVGKELRDTYTTPEQREAIDQTAARMGEHAPVAHFIADQHVGMRAAQDLLAIATGRGEVPQERVAELGRLGLVDLGEDGKPAVTHDALPLLPKGFTARLGKPNDNFRVRSLNGEKLEGAAAIVRNGQEQLEHALHGKAMAAREQTAPTGYPVRVSFTDHAGEAQERVIRGKGKTPEEGMAHAMSIAEKRGMKVTDAEHTTAEREAARKAARDPLARNKIAYVDATDAEKAVYTPEQQQALARVEGEFQRNRGLFKQFGIEKITAAKADGDASGIATSTGKLSVDPAKLIEQLASVKQRAGHDVNAGKKWVRNALMEEVVHQATIKGLGPKWAEKLKAAWNDPAMTKEMKDEAAAHAAETYDGFENLDDHQKAAEVVRMVVQGRWKGTITEQVFNVIRDLHAYLTGLKVEHSPLLQQAIDRTRAALIEARKQERMERREASRTAQDAERSGDNADSESRPAAEPPASGTPENQPSPSKEEANPEAESSQSSPEPATPAAEAQAEPEKQAQRDAEEAKAKERDQMTLFASRAKMRRLGQDPESSEGRAPDVNWDATDNYGKWSRKSVAAHLGVPADSFVYRSMVDIGDLKPVRAEREQGRDVRAGKQEVEQDFLSRAEDMLEKYTNEEARKKSPWYDDQFKEWRDSLPWNPEDGFDESDVETLGREMQARENEGSYDESEFERGTRSTGGYPPVLVTREKNGSLTLNDGNHRVDTWQNEGRYDVVPAWVNDEQARTHGDSLSAARAKPRDEERGGPVEVGRALIDKDTPVLTDLADAKGHPDAEAAVLVDKDGVHQYDLTGENPVLMATSKATGDKEAIAALTDYDIPKVRNLDEIDREDFPDATKALVIRPNTGRLELVDIASEEPIASARLLPAEEISLAAAKAKRDADTMQEESAQSRFLAGELAANIKRAKELSDEQLVQSLDGQSRIIQLHAKDLSMDGDTILPARTEIGPSTKIRFGAYYREAIDRGLPIARIPSMDAYVERLPNAGLIDGGDSLAAAKAKTPAQKEAERIAKLRETRAGFAAEQGAVPEAAPEPHVLTKPEGRSAINAYHHLARTTGFPAVSIADLADQSGVPLDRLKQQLLRSQKAGSVVLSTGDWSLASDKQRAGAIEQLGAQPGDRPMLQVRFLKESGDLAAAKAKQPKDWENEPLPEKASAEELAHWNAANEIKRNLYAKGFLTSDVMDTLNGKEPIGYRVPDIESIMHQSGDRRDYADVVQGQRDRLEDKPTHREAFTPKPTDTAFDWALQHHGEAGDIGQAGYVLPDGRLLDFSESRNGGGGDRSLDHRSIQYVGRPSEGHTAMREFMEKGAVRIDANSGAIDIAKKPTFAQEGKIRRVLEEANGGAIDVTDGKRRVAIEVNEDSIDKAMGRIRRFYAGEDIESGQLFAAKATAAKEQDRLGFYSHLSRVAEAKLPNRGTPEQIMATLKGNGVKESEMQWMGLPQFLEGKQSVSKDELRQFIAENGVQMKEVVKGDGKKPVEQSELDKVADELDRIDSGDFWDFTDSSDTKAVEMGDKAEGAIREAAEALRAGDHERGMGLLRYAGQLESDFGDDPTTSHLRKKLEKLTSEEAQEPDTKFSQYALPGGTNYKEKLLTLPSKPMTFEEYKAEQASKGVTNEDTLRDWYKHLAPQEGFKGTHWDEPNVLAHTREADHTDTEGNKVRLIEEIQSDWHQKGRKEGYAKNEFSDTPIGHAAYTNEGDLVGLGNTHQEAVEDALGVDDSYDPENGHVIPIHSEHALDKLEQDGDSEFSRAFDASHRDNPKESQRKAFSGEGVPDAPFKKTWPEVAFKRALRSAVDDGMDKLAWTPGKVHTDRYGTERIEWAKQPDGTFLVEAKSQHGGHAAGIDLEAEARARGLSKESADKVTSREELERTIKPALTEGQDAKLLSEKLWNRMQTEEKGVSMPRKEGFEGFYDKILPDFARKYVKPWGGKVETTELASREETGFDAFRDWVARNGGNESLAELKTEWANGSSRAEAFNDRQQGATVHSVTITPEMRDSVQNEGQALFAAKANALHTQVANKLAASPAGQEARSSGTKREISQDFDTTGNYANVRGVQAQTHIRLPFERPIPANETGAQKKAREAAVKMDLIAARPIVEAGGDKARLAAELAKVNASTDAKLKAKFAPIYQYALDNFDRIEGKLFQHRRLASANYSALKAAGYDPGERRDYVHRVTTPPDDPDAPHLLFETGNGNGQGNARGMLKGRSFDTMGDAIKAGYDPGTYGIHEADGRMVQNATRIIGDKAFLDKMKQVKAPTDGKPIIGEMTTRKLANGETEPKIPDGYTSVNAFGRPLVIHKMFAPLFSDLYGTSAVRNIAAGRALLKFAAAGKHGTLVFDTFHVGRLLYKMASGGGGSPIVMRDGKPAFGYHAGRSLLEYDNADLATAQKQGEITADEVEYAKKNRPQFDELVKAGLNIGKVSDNLMQQAKLKIPGLTTMNDWIFGKLQRGAMVQTALKFYDRNLSRPGVSRDQAARRTATEMNEYFGNLQNQGIFKSKTLQDVARLIFLAPNWTESQARYEARAYGQLGASAVAAARGKGLRVGNATRAMATGFVGLLAANQVINYLSRGQSTFQNEEDGHKLDAWVPGGKRGFWFNPFEIAGEYAHAAMKYAAQHENPVDVGTHILSNKLSPLGRGVKEATTGRDAMGRHFLSDADRFRSATVDSLPSPMPLGGVLEKDPRAPIGYRMTRAPGAFEKQMLQSAGAKVTAAQSPRTQMFALAQPFRPEGQYSDNAGEYTELRRALDNDQPDAVKSEMKWLLARGKDMHAIASALGVKSGGIAPERFTGGVEREKEMLKSLTPQQRVVYKQAQVDHVENAKKFLAIAHSPEGQQIVSEAKRAAMDKKRSELVH